MVPSCISCTKAASPVYDEEFEFAFQSEGERVIFVPYAGHRVRGVARCFRCNKPRCLYSRRQLSSRERSLLEELTEGIVFSCGSPVLPPIHPLQGQLYMKNLSCDDTVESAFYASGLLLPPVCVHCGENASGTKDEVSLDVRRVLPTCNVCRNAGLLPKPFITVNRSICGSSEESSELREGGGSSAIPFTQKCEECFQRNIGKNVTN